MLNAEQFQEKYARRLKGATVDIERGVMDVTESPTAKAAAKQEKMLTHLTEAVRSGKWADRLKSVSTEDWKDKMVKKGIPRISEGVDASADKVRDFAQQLLPAVQAAQKKVANMPDMTLEDNINRMTSYVREMSKFRKK